MSVIKELKRKPLSTIWRLAVFLPVNAIIIMIVLLTFVAVLMWFLDPKDAYSEAEEMFRHFC